MPRYRFGDRTVDSDWALNLPPSDHDLADIRFEVGPLDHASQLTPRPFLQHDLPDGTVWVAFYHAPNGYCIRFPALADFHVSTDGRAIRCTLEPGVPDDTLEHLLLDQVLPRTLSHGGRTVLHAAAVAVDGRALAFLGDTGWGKSTLITHLHGGGLPLVSDDCLVITNAGDPIMGLGSYPGMRLWPDSVLALGAGTDQVGSVAHYSRKRRVATRAASLVQVDPLPIAHLFLLAPPTEAVDDVIRITPIVERDRVIHLLEYSFRLDVTDRARSAREFAALCQLAERLPMSLLNYPRRYDRLPAVTAAIRAHISDLQQHVP